MEAMAEHILIVGNDKDFPGLVRRYRPDARITMMARLAALGRIKNPAAYARVISLPHGGSAAEWVEMSRAIHARDPFDRLCTFSERDQDKAASIGAALGLGTHSPDTVRWVHDKVEMRKRLAAVGLESTASQRVADLDQVRDFASRHGYPVVVKPVAGAASSGVSVVRSPWELAGAWQWAQAASVPDTSDLLAEQYLEGPEVSVEAFSEAGAHRAVCVTGKVKDPVHCLELGQLVRGPFDRPTREAASRYTVKVLDALGVTDGVTHTELVLTAAGPRVVETHLRPAGDDIPEMIRDVYGVDLLDLLVQQSLGGRVLDQLDAGLEAAAKIDQYSAIWFALPAGTGTVTAVRGAEQARAMPGVVRVEVLKEPGDSVVAQATDSLARTVSARAVADDPFEALRAARRAAESVTFTIDTVAASDYVVPETGGTQ
jgi:biotin carboxylase